MEVDRSSAQQLRKSILAKQNINTIEQKKIVLRAIDKICDKIGRQNFAYILVSISQIIYPLGFIYSNEHGLHPIQTNLLRGSIIIILSFGISRYFGINLSFQNPHNFRILMIRNSISCFQSFSFTFLQFYVPQPIVQTLTSTGPLFVFIFDYFINGITITRKQFTGFILGVGGVLLTVNGEMLLSIFDPNYKNESQFHYKSQNPLIKLLVASIFLLSTFFWGYGQVLTKKLIGANSLQISLHLAYYLLFTSAIFYPIGVNQPVPLQNMITGAFAGGLLIASGQMLFLGAMLMTKNMGIITMMIFLSVIVGYVVSILRYNEPINPFCTIGSILIVFGIARIVLSNKKQSDNTTNSKLSNDNAKN